MAGWKGHVVGGLASVTIYTLAVSFGPVERLAELAGFLHNWHVSVAVFIIGLLFAIFPDVDTNSKAQDLFFGMIFLLDVLLIANGYIQVAAYLGLMAMLPIISHHRGWTHEIWAMFIVPLPVLLVPYLYNSSLLLISIIYYGAAVVGYFSHLFFDGLIWRKISRRY